MAAAEIETSWRPLGQVLVARGFLSQEHLELALDEQAITGRRLGEVLIGLGFVSPSTLSLALAEQYGFHSSAESGFGTGLRAQLAQRPSAGLAEPPAFQEPTPLAAIAEPEEDSNPLAQLEEQWAKLAAAEERLAELQRLHERRHAQVLRLLGRIRHRTSERVAAGEVAAPPGHLLFVQLGAGYELIEREGAPPARDARLSLPHLAAAEFVVTNVARSPLPGDRRPCAFVQPLRYAIPSRG